jgi:hypothetical protein
MRFVNGAGWVGRGRRITRTRYAALAAAGLADQPLAPWAGMGVLSLWSAVALGVGALPLRVRDA